MAKSEVIVTRAAAVKLFEELGITTAAKWNAKRMAAKLEKVQDMVDDEVVLSDKAKDTLSLVIGAKEDGMALSVSDKKGAAPAEAKKGAAPAEAKKGAAKAAAPKAAAKPEASKTPSIPGVREVRTRPFLAGIVIKNAGGLKAGVTEDMVAELDKLYGKTNPAESLFTLRNAWHAIRGILQGE